MGPQGERSPSAIPRGCSKELRDQGCTGVGNVPRSGECSLWDAAVQLWELEERTHGAQAAAGMEPWRAQGLWNLIPLGEQWM